MTSERKYQVIVYNRFYGADERQEYETQKEAKAEARRQLDKDNTGAMVYNLSQGKIIYECGEPFPEYARPSEASRDFKVDGIDYEAQRVSAIPSQYISPGENGELYADTSKRVDAVLVIYKLSNGEHVQELHFGWMMPENAEEFAFMLENNMYPETDWTSLNTIKRK